MYLPKIDDEILEYLDDTDLIDFNPLDGGYTWSQIAVDFVAILDAKLIKEDEKKKMKN